MNKLYLILILFSYHLYLLAAPLTKTEPKIIDIAPLHCVSTGEWAPFNFLEEHQLKGIGLDYWHLIQKKAHIKESPCSQIEKWTDVLSAIRNKSADMTIATSPTKEKKEYAVFSKPYAEYPIVIVTRSDIGFIDNIKLLKGKTIVVGKAYSTASILQKYYPDLPLTYVDSINEGLKMVNQGKAFATVGALPVISYNLHKHNLNNLKISGSIPMRFPVSIMLRKEYRSLLPSINKAIDNITLTERDIINKKWITISHSHGIPKTYFYTLLAGSILLFFLFALWLYKLKREIYQKDHTTKKLHKLVTIDALTSIYNRYMFNIAVNKEITFSQRNNLPLSLIFFDIDHFKMINDHYGHKTGDEILKSLAKIVLENIRESDIFCRWGGDEFIIILPDTSEEDAKKLAKKLSRSIKKHLFIKDIKLSCGFGVTQLQKRDTSSSFISRADQLLYEAKGSAIKQEHSCSPLGSQ